MRLLLRHQFFVSLILALVLAAFGYSQLLRERELFVSDTAADNRTIARWLSGVLAQTWDAQGRDGAERFLQQSCSGPGAARARLVTADPDEQADSEPAVSLDRAGAEGAERVLVRAPVTVRGAVVANVEVSESLVNRDQYVVRSLWRQAALGTALLSSATLLSTFLGYRLVGRPVGMIVRRAEQAGAGDLRSRLGMTGGDELGAIARALDTMCERLADASERERESAQAQLRSVQQLRRAERLALVGTMASGIAHELGTPLNIVRITAKEIGSGPETDPSLSSLAGAIVEQTDRMARLVRDLLDFARPRAANRLPIDLGALVRRTAAMVEPVARKHGVRIEIAAAPTEAVPCFVDPTQIEQVLSNLLINAVHAQAASPGHAVRVEVDATRAVPEAGWAPVAVARVRVIDRGPGMSPELLACVFEPFVSTKPAGEGTGLGLTVSQSLVAENGGWIVAQSTVGAGSVFSVHLPAVPDNQA